MGGLVNGSETSEIIARVMPGFVEEIIKSEAGPLTADRAAARLLEKTAVVSDSIFNTARSRGWGGFGSTFCCAWLVGQSAVFVNLGDSRGWILPRRSRLFRRVTEDHNLAAELVKAGEISRAEARGHPSASRLTRFVGMSAPACPDSFVEAVFPGDRILLCSDGLYGMVEDETLRALLRRGKSPAAVCKGLVDAANEAGGADNISAVYIKMER
jgi:serine/threonine protein phosphatase PrpC